MVAASFEMLLQRNCILQKFCTCLNFTSISKDRVQHTRVNIKTVIAGQTIDTHQRRIHEKSRWIQGKIYQNNPTVFAIREQNYEKFCKWHCFLINENEFCFCGMLHSNINNKCFYVMLSHTFALVLNVVW